MKAKIYLLLLLASLFLIGCSDDEDNRITPEARVVAMEIGKNLYNIEEGAQGVTIDQTNKVITLVLNSGIDLSEIKTSILVSNGQLQNFENKLERDLRQPFTIDINGENGQNATWKIVVQSPPKILRVSVDDPIVSQNETFVVEKSFTIITQIEEGTDVSALKVNYDMTNGTFVDYVNGSEVNYTEPYELKILGSDGTTVYTYKVIFTTESVGPATIDNLEIDGVAVKRFVIADDRTVQPYVEYLKDFSKVNLNIVVSSTNTVDPSYKPEGVNLLANPKVNITGIDGVTLEFTIRPPLVEGELVVANLHEDILFGAHSGSSLGFSGSNLVVASNAMAAGAPGTAGLRVYDYTGNFVKNLSTEGTNLLNDATYGVRKLAVDDKGKILGVQLGASSGDNQMKIYKWDSVDSTPVPYITYSKSSLGLTKDPRAAGINVEGSLDGNATIAVPISGSDVIFVWKVTNGVLNPTPEKGTLPISSGNYYSVQPFGDSYVGVSDKTPFVYVMDNSFAQKVSLGGTITTDVSAIEHNGRKYIAYVVYNGARHAYKMTDITDLNNRIEIMNIAGRNVGNGNATVDVDLKVVDGRLHVAFLGTNDGVYVYKLEE